MLNLILFGPPGAGKGTQAKFLTDSFNLIHLSTGDILRTEIAAETPLGVEARKYIDKGELVPDSVVIGMICEKCKSSTGARGFIFDGFPRTIEQAQALDELLNSKGNPITGMLSLEVEEQELIDRLMNRGKISGRSDDQNLDIIKNRIIVYHQKTTPLIRYYAGQGKHYSINGMGSVEEIAARLTEAVEKLQKKPYRKNKYV